VLDARFGAAVLARVATRNEADDDATERVANKIAINTRGKQLDKAEKERARRAGRDAHWLHCPALNTSSSKLAAEWKISGKGSKERTGTHNERQVRR
jgi:hypothetical protein